MGEQVQSASLVSLLGPSFPQRLTQMSRNIDRCSMAHVDVRSTRVYLEPIHLMLWPVGEKHNGLLKVKGSNALWHTCRTLGVQFSKRMFVS